MTPAQVERELKRQQKEIEAARKKAERDAVRQRKAEEKAAAAAARARQRSIDSAIRTGGKVVTSRLGQDVIRGVFGRLRLVTGIRYRGSCAAAGSGSGV
jgi:hypothetical protein